MNNNMGIYNNSMTYLISALNDNLNYLMTGSNIRVGKSYEFINATDDGYKYLYDILVSNGCLIKSGIDDIKYVVYDLANKFNNRPLLIFVYGMLGNDVNKFFDVVEYNDKIGLVIFMDYFTGIHTEEAKHIENTEDAMETDENGNIILHDTICGNSDYIYALKNIIETFMELSYGVPQTSRFIVTSFNTKYRYIPTILACALISIYRPIEEFELEGIPVDYEYCMHIISTKSLSDIVRGIIGE
jgi:hypothetical protein